MMMNASEELTLLPVPTLESLDAKEVERSAALITFLCVIAATGIPGNLLVCAVYFRTYTKSMSRYFIFWLAVNDTINSCVILLELIAVSHPYTYPSEWLCKVTIFLEMWPTLTSGTLLGVIGIERYRKVCHPFGWQIRQNHARNIYIAIIAVALVYSWPTLVFFGKRDVEISPFNVTGQACLIREEYDGSIYMTVYSGLLWLIFLAVLLVLVIFYSLIGKKIVHQMKKSDQLSVSGSQHTFSKVAAEDLTSSESGPSRSSNSIKNETGAIVKTSLSKPRLSAVSTGTSMKSQRAASARRSAYIMFLISLVFVLSFVPYLSLRLVGALDKTFMTSLTATGRAVFNFFLRCYFLNAAINPFIYGACVAQFRNDVKMLFRRRLCTKM